MSEERSYGRRDLIEAYLSANAGDRYGLGVDPDPPSPAGFPGDEP